MRGENLPPPWEGGELTSIPQTPAPFLVVVLGQIRGDEGWVGFVGREGAEDGMKRDVMCVSVCLGCGPRWTDGHVPASLPACLPAFLSPASRSRSWSKQQTTTNHLAAQTYQHTQHLHPVPVPRTTFKVGREPGVYNKHMESYYLRAGKRRDPQVPSTPTCTHPPHCDVTS